MDGVGEGLRKPWWSMPRSEDDEEVEFKKFKGGNESRERDGEEAGLWTEDEELDMGKTDSVELRAASNEETEGRALMGVGVLNSCESITDPRRDIVGVLALGGGSSSVEGGEVKISCACRFDRVEPFPTFLRDLNAFDARDLKDLDVFPGALTLFWVSSL